MDNFEYKNVSSFDEAGLFLKEKSGEALPLSGGTDLLGVFKDRILPDMPKTVVNLKGINGYDKIEETAGEVVLGAGARLDKVAKLKSIPALAEAAYSVASPLIRARATVGGNICQDVRCWYYRYPDSIGGALQCKRKGGDTCYAIHGENQYHSVFGGISVHGSACTKSCPAGIDIAGYMEEMRSGNWDAAAEIILKSNPMPMFTSRVCPHHCQDNCNQNLYGESVNIHVVERSVGDHILKNMDKFYAAPKSETGKTIAIVGAGPGGLSAAYYLRKAGHTVTVYDRMEKAGGVLRYGIPHYRLPKTLVDTFIAALEKMGVQFKLGVNVGVDVSAQELQKSHNSVYFGTGAWKQPVLGLDGEKLTEFGLNFLVEVNTYLQKAIGSDVLVCGGGSVAMDVAVSAMRLGAKSVKLVCLEQRDEMPATAEEVKLALEEGLQIFNGWGLGRVVTGDGGKIRGLEAKKCLSVFNAEGRFAPVYDEKDIMLIESDNIILATGQRVDLDFLGPELSAQIKSSRGLIDADLETSKTKAPGVYAGGDAVTGPNIAVKAIAAGRFAAEGINTDLGARTASVSGNAAVLTHFNRDGIKIEKSARLSETPAAERSLSKEDTASLPAEAAVKEAERCMHCGCYAVNASDLAPALMALDAMIITTERSVPAEVFFTSQLNPRDILYPGELVKEIRIPVQEGISHYDKVRTRNAIDFAILGLASRLVTANGVVKEARLVLGGAAPVPVRLKSVEDLITGKAITNDTAAQAAAASLRDLCIMEKNEYKLAAMTAVIKDALLRAAK